MRSRLYLTRPEGKDDVDPDLRVLTTKKSNYGKAGAEIHMRWHEGVFVLDDGKPSAVAGLLNKRHDQAFRSLLSAVNRTGQRVASTKGVNYAPTVLAAMPDANGMSKKSLESAMRRLLADGIIKGGLGGAAPLNNVVSVSSYQRRTLGRTPTDFHLAFHPTTSSPTTPYFHPRC